MHENDSIFEPQRIMLDLFSQNAERESNFTSCRHCSQIMVKSLSEHGQFTVSFDHGLTMVIDHERPWSNHGFHFTNMVDHGLTMVSWWSDHGQLVVRPWSVMAGDHGRPSSDHGLTTNMSHGL